MIALMLVGAACFLGLAATVAQVNRIAVHARDSLKVYAERAQREPKISSRTDVERIIAGTSHPGWMLSIAVDDVRYLVRWSPLRITVEPRNAMLIHPPPRPTAPITALASFFGAELPAHTSVNDEDMELFAATSVQAAVLRTFAATLLVALAAILFALRVAERMARETLRPLGALHEALGHMAETLDPHAVSGTERRDEVGDVVAAYNRAVEAERKARSERDAAKARTHEFIADAGHQLRTPLTVLSGFVDILRKGQLRHPDDGPRMLEKMERQIGLMRKLVERLMLLESWHSTDPHPSCEPTDVGQFVMSVVDPIAAACPQDDIRVCVTPNATACIDTAELEHAVTNIVANAIKYAPGGQIIVDVTTDEKWVYIAIADRGPGIPPETLPHVFERFYRGTRDVPGSGLGLAIAKTAVERAHGTVRVESAPGEGTRFTIAIPRVVSTAAAPVAI